VVAATDIMNDKLLFFRDWEIVAVMNVLAKAAGVRARRECEAERGEVRYQRDEY
jgi:hypothetical protein